MTARGAFYLIFSCLCASTLAAVQVSLPSSPPGDEVTVVYPNFMGISLELSFINYYFGNDTSSIPQPVLNYLAALHERSAGRPVRLRLGGNSMDSSTYIPSQNQPLINFTNPDANVNDQPVTYGQTLFHVMKDVSNKVGVEWLIGLSLRDPNSTNTPLLAGDAQSILGDDLDAFLLGNEPDLYTSHGQRPNIANYTVYDYIGEYWVAFNNLGHTPQGDILSLNKIAGPTICCSWDLNALLTSGWLEQFQNRLKYITLQHYPQNYCFGSYPFHLDYYMSHKNTVGLARWQKPGLDYLASVPSAQRKPVLMDEFNSAACGGIPESNTFGLGLWTADYALQLASVGYSGAYLHTREPGIPYNVFDPPNGTAGTPGAWYNAPNFYGMLAVTEALQNPAGSKVVDLNINNSTNDGQATAAGYAVYNGSSGNVYSAVLFNYANASAQGADYELPASLFTGAKEANSVLVRYLTAANATETTNVIWGNQTYAGRGDGTLAATTTDWKDRTYSCSSGCTIQIPGPGMAVVFIGGTQPPAPAPSIPSQAQGSGGSGGSGNHATSTYSQSLISFAIPSVLLLLGSIIL